MPYGTVNADVIQTSTTGGILGAGNASIMKNRIINGAMVIDQRNAGASVATTTLASGDIYCLDRWVLQGSQNSKFTAQQNAGSVTPPAGFTNYIGITSSSAYSISAGDYFDFYQYIEGFNAADLGFGTANAKTITLSFWARSSLTGTFGGVVSNNNYSRCYPYSYTINSANTWEYKTVTIAGDTSGTWLTTNGRGMQVSFGIACGSTYAGAAGSWSGTQYLGVVGQTSVVGTNGATFYITGVQLEVGSSATGFEYVNYQTSLANCQRYYAKTTGNTSGAVGFGLSTGAATATVYAKCPTTMRTTPTVSQSSTTVSDCVTYTPTVTSIAGANYTIDSVRLDLNTNAGTTMTTYRPCTYQLNGSSGFVAFSAEL